MKVDGIVFGPGQMKEMALFLIELAKHGAVIEVEAGMTTWTVRIVGV